MGTAQDQETGRRVSPPILPGTGELCQHAAAARLRAVVVHRPWPEAADLWQEPQDRRDCQDCMTLLCLGSPPYGPPLSENVSFDYTPRGKVPGRVPFVGGGVDGLPRYLYTPPLALRRIKF